MILVSDSCMCILCNYIDGMWRLGRGVLLKFFSVSYFLYICTFIHSCGKYLECVNKYDNFCDSGCRGFRLGIRKYSIEKKIKRYMNKGYIHSTEIMTNKLSNTFGTVGGGTERGKGRGS